MDASPETIGTVISNGQDRLLVPESELRHVDDMAKAKDPGPEPEFDWNPENPDIGWAAQPATALYLNSWGQVVIRQQGEWNDDSDPVVRVSLHHVQSLIDRLQAIMREQ